MAARTFKGTLETALGGSRGCLHSAAWGQLREGPLSNSGACLATQAPWQECQLLAQTPYFILSQEDPEIKSRDPVSPPVAETHAPPCLL